MFERSSQQLAFDEPTSQMCRRSADVFSLFFDKLICFRIRPWTAKLTFTTNVILHRHVEKQILIFSQSRPVQHLLKQIFVQSCCASVDQL